MQKANEILSLIIMYVPKLFLLKLSWTIQSFEIYISHKRNLVMSGSGEGAVYHNNANKEKGLNIVLYDEQLIFLRPMIDTPTLIIYISTLGNTKQMTLEKCHLRH